MKFFKKVLEIKSKAGVLHFTRWAIFETKYFGLYIHKINQSDKDKYLHSHPWNFVSVILKGSYEEEHLNWSNWPVEPKPRTTFNLKKFLTVSRMNRLGLHRIHKIVKGPVYSMLFFYGKHDSWFYLVNSQKIESTVFRELKNKNELPKDNVSEYDYKYYNV